MRITLLGCGGSGGVPLANGDWGQCDPTNPKNRRRRVSVLAEAGSRTILIDTSPDMRAQLQDAGVASLDAVLYTHEHADHCHGIDDLRAFLKGRRGRPIPAFGSAETIERLRARFGYIFAGRMHGDAPDQLYPPLLEPSSVDGRFDAAGVPVCAFAQDHGQGATSTGYRIGGFAYSTDLIGLPDPAFAALGGLDLWIVDCLRFEPHPTHAHFDLALEWAARLRPRRTVLTHLSIGIDYEDARRRCPKGVEPGYDGMVFELAEPDGPVRRQTGQPSAAKP